MACIQATDWPKSLIGRSHRPGRAETSVGIEPSTTAPIATTVTNCRHPNSARRRSTSKAATPRPIDAAMATAAGPNRTRGSMARLPVHPRPMIQAANQNTRAMVQNRAAHRKRAPRARISGTRAATANPHARGDAPIGPTANRSNEPHDAASDVGVGTPNTATAPRPADNTPITQGRQITPAAAVAPSASQRACRPERQSRSKMEEITRVTAASTTTTAAAGTKEIRTASTRPSATMLPSLRWRPFKAAHRPATDGARDPSSGPPPSARGVAAGPPGVAKGTEPVAWNRNASTQGAPAYMTRASHRPSASASYGRAMARYARPATNAARCDRKGRSRRTTPQTPSGTQAKTSTFWASPIAPSSTVPTRPARARAGVAGAVVPTPEGCQPVKN